MGCMINTRVAKSKNYLIKTTLLCIYLVMSTVSKKLIITLIPAFILVIIISYMQGQLLKVLIFLVFMHMW